jgi:hypothetical protein
MKLSAIAVIIAISSPFLAHGFAPVVANTRPFGVQNPTCMEAKKKTAAELARMNESQKVDEAGVAKATVCFCWERRCVVSSFVLLTHFVVIQ